MVLLTLQVLWPWTRMAGQDAELFREVRQQLDRIYGSDYNLLNGRQYSMLYSSSSHPYLDGELPRPGRVVMNGVVYEEVPINYDLYQQAVVLQAISQTGQIRYIELNREFLDEFQMGGKIFRKISFPGEKEQYAQVIEGGLRRFVIRWKKEMNYSASMNQTPYRYTGPSKKIFLEESGGMVPVGSRSSFLNRFDENKRYSVRQFMKQQRIRLKRASDLQLQMLLQYADQLEEQDL